MTFLSIAVPTYNRAYSLKKTLYSISSQIKSCPELINQVQVVVSDNGSGDDTEEVLAKFDSGVVNFRYYRQNENLGLDRNMRYLYNICDSEYVWYFSDDDVLYANAIKKIVAALQLQQPDALLFSFVQPVGSTQRTFNFDQEVTVVESHLDIIKCMAQFPKLSIYVFRKVVFNKDDEVMLKQYLGSDFDFIAVSYSIFYKSSKPKLCILSEPLAGCNKGFNHVRFSPQTWGNAWIVYQHPFVKQYAPDIEEIERKNSYYNLIQALYAVKVGALVPDDITSYDKCIETLAVNMFWLLTRPKAFFQLFLLKLGLAHVWGRYMSRSRVFG